MRHLILAGLCALTLAACQSGSTQKASLGDQPQLSVPEGGQSVRVAADPVTVRTALVSSAKERGTIVIQDQPNMVVMERQLTGENSALDKQFGPSDNGNRVIRIRVRFTGSSCETLAVQDLAVINNVRTALEQSFVLPGNPNTMQSLQGLKSRAEKNSSCPPITS